MVHSCFISNFINITGSCCDVIMADVFFQNPLRGFHFAFHVRDPRGESESLLVKYDFQHNMHTSTAVFYIP